MTLHNNSTPRINYSGIVNTSPVGAGMRPRPSALNTRMIDRIHHSKPGCSACGKK
jgi:hypothetical protein